MLGLYIHIPFCVQKCNYCDFLSFAASQDKQEKYVDALLKEIEIYGRSGHFRLASLYFGGGTPTLLKAELFAGIFDTIRRNFTFADDIEITVESNPGTLDLSKAQTLKSLGVNRISLGVQSFHEDELGQMGRVHTKDDVVQAVGSIREAGFDNYSFDIMAGLPGQTEEKLLATLQDVLALKPKHISMYGLKLEQGTPWEILHHHGKLTIPDDDETADMMLAAQETLVAKGFTRYEISNYALPGFNSSHNLRYWLNEEYLGLGLGASSFFQSERFSNTRNMEQYFAMLNKAHLPVVERETITIDLEQSETVFLGLRLVEGLELERFRLRFDKDILEVFPMQIEKHLALELLEMTDTHLRLTVRGMELANEVMQDFII